MSEKTVKPEVQFIDCAPQPSEKARRHLTAKYDRQQRRVINRRIKLEDFIYDTVRSLYNCKDEDSDPECDIDLDDVTKLETDDERSQHLKNIIINCPASEETVKAFIDELLKKLRSL